MPRKKPNEFKRKKPASHQKAQARNRVTPKESSKASPIKLLLSEYKNHRTAFRHALDNSYRWTPFNIHEIKEYLKDVETNLNPVTFDILQASSSYVRPVILMNRHLSGTPAKDIYKYAGLPWNTPPYFPWLKSFLELWEVSRSRSKLRYKNFTVKEWFEAVGLELPLILEADANIIITRKSDLTRTGIFVDLDLKIKKSLKILDEFEQACLIWHQMSEPEKVPIKILVNTPSLSKDHPYRILLKELIEADQKKF